MEIDINAGGVVMDDLTGKKCKVLVATEDGLGYIIDSPYLKGARHVWEVSKL